MSNMNQFDSKTTLNISEGYDLQNQEHYVNRRRGLGDCFHKKCSFRVWQVLVSLLVVAAIITVMGLLIAMLGPGNTDLRYSEKESRVAPTEGDKHTSSGHEGTQTTGEPGTETVEPTKQQSTSRPSESSPYTSPTTPPDDKTPLKCEVAIVGGGTGGLLLAYELLKTKTETDVCIFEKENRLGGKILDHRFPEAPNVTVGLGKWNRPGLSYGVSELIEEFTNSQRSSWIPRVGRVEARGVYARDFDSLELKAFPTLSDNSLMNNMTVQKTAEDLKNKNANNFSTAGTFLSGYLSPEGAKLMEEVYGFKGGYMQAINPKSYKKYLKETFDQNNEDNDRPPRGMSEIIERLDLKVRHSNGTIFLQEAVTSISKKGSKFVLVTTNFTVEAKKTVLAVDPPALKKLTGDVIQSITSHDIFMSIVSVPAFSGAAVYPTAWWNDSVAAQKNNSLEPLQMFISSSNCLGITMPYRGTGPNGTAVLHTVSNNGGCSDMWGNILKISKDAVDREMKKALEYKFQRTIPVEPLDTVYKYWEGYWYFQKPGSSFPLKEIKDWAKRPLTGNDVFLVGNAFYNFGGWLEDTILSTNEALKEGWNVSIIWV